MRLMSNCATAMSAANKAVKAPTQATTARAGDTSALETYPFRKDRFVLVVARDHALSDFMTCQPLIAGRAEDAEHVVLRGRETRFLEHVLQIAHQPIGGALGVDEHFLLDGCKRLGNAMLILESNHVA